MGSGIMIQKIKDGDVKTLARCISLVENEAGDYKNILVNLPNSNTPVIGLTGPPGAGKSTLTDALISHIVAEGKRVGVLCVDPSSPFNLGAVLGDRIRMSKWYTHDRVFIRSLASRGSMGGLNPKIIEITDVMKASNFDLIVVETVGVGQSEIEIAGLADITVVVLVPEAGDEIQTMKAGLMEIADIFAVNKSDRPGADIFAKNLRMMLAPAFSRTQKEIPIVSTVAHKNEGVDKLYDAIKKYTAGNGNREKKAWLLTEKVSHIVQKQRMKDFVKPEIKKLIEKQMVMPDFNLYKFVSQQFAV